MFALPRTPAGRIALAIGLSLLVHALMLFAPMIKLQPSEPPLPPLMAKLEPLPKIAPKPRPVKKSPPKPALPEPAAPAPAEPQPAEPQPAEAPQSAAEPAAVAAEPASAVGVATTTEESRPAHPIPKHAQLTFVVYMGTNVEVGEARHRLDIAEDKTYTLKIGTNTTGLARLFKSYEMSQVSTGTVTTQGLRPEVYSLTRSAANGKDVIEAKFDWQAKSLSFSDDRAVALPDQAQDFASFLYQLSQLPLDKSVVPIYISNGKKLERYELSIGAEEEIKTRLGTLRAVPLRKEHAAGEEGLEIWLGLEYRLLPIKIRHLDRDGQIKAEMVIADIRVADE